VDGSEIAMARRSDAMNAAEERYMRGDRPPVPGSVPHSTSKYLNSPLFVHAFSRMSLRRFGPDVPITYDIPDMVRAIADVLEPVELHRLCEAEKVKNPAFAAWLAKRQLTSYNPHEMSSYAPGTLGAELRDYLLRTGFVLEFVHSNVEPASDIEYLQKRNGACHDIQHIVTGFGPNVAGEHALALMNLTCSVRHFEPAFGQALSMANIFVAASGLSRTAVNYPDGLELQLEATRLGIEAGQTIRAPLLTVEWERYLDWTLDDIAADLGFERGPGAAWDVSNALCAG
jgi:ubiquinone biosynthesis protein COQ4